MNVFILGAGKVGRALSVALKKQGVPVTLRAARQGVPSRPIDATIVVLALRERQLSTFAADLARSGVVAHDAVVVHNAGSLDAEILGPLRECCAGVARGIL